MQDTARQTLFAGQGKAGNLRSATVDVAGSAGDAATSAGEGAAYTAGAAVGSAQVRWGIAPPLISCPLSGSGALPAFCSHPSCLLQAAAGGVMEAGSRALNAAGQAAKGAYYGAKGEAVHSATGMHGGHAFLFPAVHCPHRKCFIQCSIA